MTTHFLTPSYTAWTLIASGRLDPVRFTRFVAALTASRAIDAYRMLRRAP